VQSGVGLPAQIRDHTLADPGQRIALHEAKDRVEQERASLHLGELGLFPLLAALHADALQELARGLHVSVLRAPVLREVPAKGRREDRLAELLEQRRHGVERLPGATGAGLEGLELGDDAALFVEGGHRHACSQDLAPCQLDLVRRAGLHRLEAALHYRRPNPCVCVLWRPNLQANDGNV
jgi:hypothetical protein